LRERGVNMKKEEWIRSLKILGLDENAGFEEIQSAYRHLVLRFHPDVNRKSDAPKRFREIVEAYGLAIEILREHSSRAGEGLIESVRKDRVIRQMNIKELESRYRESSSPNVRASALIALALHGGRFSRDILFEGLRDSEERVRSAAIQVSDTVCRLNDVPKVFVSVLFERNWDLRKKAFIQMYRIIKKGFKDLKTDTLKDKPVPAFRFH
jgi:curved DNA-binding protein CbpA